MNSQKVRSSVTPAKAGVQNQLKTLDRSLRLSPVFTGMTVIDDSGLFTRLSEMIDTKILMTVY